MLSDLSKVLIHGDISVSDFGTREREWGLGGMNA